ncbi:MAG: hypothetical protein ACI9EK_002060 [Psychroserpens sp.]
MNIYEPNKFETLELKLGCSLNEYVPGSRLKWVDYDFKSSMCVFECVCGNEYRNKNSRVVKLTPERSVQVTCCKTCSRRNRYYLQTNDKQQVFPLFSKPNFNPSAINYLQENFEFEGKKISEEQASKLLQSYRHYLQIRENSNLSEHEKHKVSIDNVIFISEIALKKYFKGIYNEDDGKTNFIIYKIEITEKGKACKTYIGQTYGNVAQRLREHYQNANRKNVVRDERGLLYLIKRLISNGLTINEFENGVKGFIKVNIVMQGPNFNKINQCEIEEIERLKVSLPPAQLLNLKAGGAVVNKNNKIPKEIKEEVEKILLTNQNTPSSLSIKYLSKKHAGRGAFHECDSYTVNQFLQSMVKSLRRNGYLSGSVRNKNSPPTFDLIKIINQHVEDGHKIKKIAKLVKLPETRCRALSDNPLIKKYLNKGNYPLLNLEILAASLVYYFENSKCSLELRQVMSPKSAQLYIKERDLINFEYFRYDCSLLKGGVDDSQKIMLIELMEGYVSNPESINKQKWFKIFSGQLHI